jgi:hypothetical protein
MNGTTEIITWQTLLNTHMAKAHPKVLRRVSKPYFHGNAEQTTHPTPQGQYHM